MRRLLLVLLASCPLPAAAQPLPVQPPAAAYAGKPVAEIRLLIEGRPTDEPALTDLVETPVGTPLSPAAIRESITHLFSLSRFEDVQVEATDVPGGVKLTYNLIPLHNVSRVDFVGTLGISEDVVRRRVGDRFGPRPTVGRAVELLRTLLEQIYPDYGFFRATGTWRQVVEHDPDRTILIFDVNAGPRAEIGHVAVAGDPIEPREAFQRSVHAEPGLPYEPVTIHTRLDEYVARMRKKRRYEAVANLLPKISEDGTVADLTIEVQPGPIVGVAIEGDPLRGAKMADLVPIEREGSADEDLIEDSAGRIADVLRRQGYWKTTVTAERRLDRDLLTITFTVRNGLPYRISDAGVAVSGNTAVSVEQLRPFLDKLQPGLPFVEANLRAVADAIAALYLGLGFAQVKVTPSAIEMDPVDNRGVVNPTITIVEGPRVVIGAVTFAGNSTLASAQLESVVKSRPGAPFYTPQVVADKDAVLLEYLNAGFLLAEVVVRPAFADNGTRADVAFRITEGARILVGHIIIVGNTRTNRRTIERELRLKPGQPLGLEDQLESQRRLAALSLFRRARISTVSHGDPAVRDVVVTVEEAAATTMGYGGGLEATELLRETTTGEARGHYEFAPRGFFEVGRRNLGGKNRSINLYTRVSLRPDTTPEDPTQGVSAFGFGFSDYRVVSTYREPRAFSTGADLTITAAVEQGVRTSFNFARKGVSAEAIQRLKPGITAIARYSFNTTRTFDEHLSEEEQAKIDRIFPEVRLSSFGGALSRDTRDDILDPSRGTLVSVESTIAARVLGGEVGFAKSYTQGLWFHRLPVKRRVIAAVRAAIGLADGFTQEVGGIEVDDLPASERFFAGGDTSIRGFALDAVGTPETIAPSGFPKGGNAVLILNGELRAPVWGDFGAAFFVDGGNVFARVTDFDMSELRGAVGFGVRYKLPGSVGTVRLDVGYKLDLRPTDGRRRAIHFSIGQAF